MKKCPQCGTQYSDVTLNFCLDDGTPLVAAAQADTPTVILGQPDTVLNRGPGRAGESQVTHVAALQQPTAKGSNATTAVAVTIVGMLVLCVVAVVALIYFRNSQEAPPRNDNNKQNTNVVFPNTNSYASPLPTESPMPTSTASMNANLPPPSTPETDDAGARAEVSQRLSNWKSAMESGDLDGYMSNYASTVDYYNRRGASISEVRADKARAFARYSSKRVSISNVNIYVSGDSATAIFDKEWTFSGDGTNAGKVRSQFRFRRTGGRWLITGENDLKVYYSR